MMKYSEIKKELENLQAESKLEVVPQEETNKILEAYPDIPPDYLSFLNEVGAGSIKDSAFCLYPGPVNFIDLGLENTYALPPGVMLFGDNFSGDFSGFDLGKKDSVVEFWHEYHSIFHTGKSFDEYIRSVIYA